jgi:glycosyltransferase involved in cell wall biosynthesis
MPQINPPTFFGGYTSLVETQEERIAIAGPLDPTPNKLQSLRKVKVSLITVVRNGEGTLRRTIESCLTQTYGHIEYIIIDGGSTDGSLEIIREYDEKIARWISEPDRGISDAFNKGVALASGELIGFINADDWLEPDAIKSIVSWIKSFDEPAIVHGMIQNWSEDRVEYLVGGNHELLKTDMTINHPTVFATAECYRRFGLFRLDFKYAMDYEWLLRLYVGGAHFSYLPKLLVNMQLGGISDAKWYFSIWEVARAKNLHLKRWFNAYGYYLLQIFKGGTRRLLEVVGFGYIVRQYRKYFSFVEKMKS